MPKETFFNLPEEKRAAIIAIALDEFADNDYKNASVSRIVATAGIAKGSFYQYFDDKQDLYLYLVELVNQEKQAFLRQLPMTRDSMDVFSYLRWLLSVGVGFEFSSPRMARLGYRAVFGDAPLPDDVARMVRSGGQAFFGQLVEAGKAQGVIRPDVDSDLAAFMFNAVFMELGRYMLNRLALDPRQLLDDGPGVLANDEAQSVFDGVMTILEQGLALKEQQ